MAKVKFLIEASDKDNLSHIFKVGEIVEFPMERALAAVEKGVCELIAEEENAEVNENKQKPKAKNRKK